MLISHNHYDHLDLPTVLRLHKRFDPLFITPLGVDQFLHKNEITNTKDLDWWNEATIGKYAKVNAVPARHFSGRGVFDRDKTLWCGYVLESPSGTIYFAGDTAYGNFFAEFKNRFSPIDIALIPIGAYKPRWFMQHIHCNPDEAVQIHKDVNAQQSIGTHFGTFPLADEGMTEPKNDLAEAIKRHGIPATEFMILEEGKTKLFTEETVQKLTF